MRSRLIPILILALAAALVVIDRLAILAPPAYTQKGFDAFSHGDMVGAIRNFAQAQKHCETDILARRMLGMAYQNYHWNDEALKQYDSVWTLGTQNIAIAMRNAGQIHQGRGDDDKALECYLKALGVDPRFAAVWADIASLHEDAGKLEFAAQAIGRAIEIAPGEKFFQETHARILAKLKDAKPAATSTPATGGQP